jgi:hypothetical protein
MLQFAVIVSWRLHAWDLSFPHDTSAQATQSHE